MKIAISIILVVIIEVLIVVSAGMFLLYIQNRYRIKSITGFIVIGYQGVGKSTLANKELRYIDFESSSFKISGERTPEWWLYYCNAALNLAESGYVVFTSSHKEVRDYFADYMKTPDHLDVYMCYPHLSLQAEWTSKLKQRFQNTQSSKDYAAWKNAEDRYVENIQELMDTPFIKIVIRSSQYDLDPVFHQLVSDHIKPHIKQFKKFL